ncbi:MAG TPA: nuclear transport factor 2 family protein [Pyrinomonadaceae bacterium]|jgi:ketosteroid isomerase-like protein
MPAHTPEEVHALFAQYFSGEDMDGIISLYEPDAALMPQPGTIVHGVQAIREALGGFLALKGGFEMQPVKLIQTSDLALLYSRWSLKGTGPDGNAIELRGQTSDVARRQADGTWLLAIDNPYGGEGMG